MSPLRLLGILLVSALFLGAAAGGSNGDAAAGPSLAVTRYGRYEAEEGVLSNVDSVASGVVVTGRRHRLVETTLTIPCRIGETWGFEFEIDGLSADRPAQYRSEMRHPPIRQPDGTLITLTVVKKTIAPGGPARVAELWSFLPGFENELVAGAWTRTVFVNERELASMTFELETRDPAGQSLDRLPVLGIRYERVFDVSRQSAQRGARVIGVLSDTPAEACGLCPGDVVVSVSGVPIENPDDLHTMLRRNAGRTVTIGITRVAAEIVLPVTLLPERP